MDLFLTGLSHKTAPIEIRERLAFSGEGLELALGKLRRLPGISEAVMLCTCNRTEVYAISGNADAGVSEVADWLGERSASDLRSHLYSHSGRDALFHLFRVASSLDSMVVGEPQILGQVKEAFAAAQAARATGSRIERVFGRAFQVAKRVRSQTGIGENAVSMSFVAVELARKVFQDLRGRQVLLVGAGEMCELAATHLVSNGAEKVTVANRSLDRARVLAERFGGEARGLGEVPRLLAEADIVLSSTAAPGYLITRDQMAKAVKARKYRPILVIDLAVPRDVEPGVNDLANVYSYDVDDMQKVVDDNLQHRAEEAERGERLVRREVTAFIEEDQARSVLPVVAALRFSAERTAMDEVEKTLRRLERAGLTDEQAESVRAMGRAIVKKVLHQPTVGLRASAATEDGERIAAAMVSLFGLDVDAVNAEIAAEKARRRAQREAARHAPGEGQDAETDNQEDAPDNVVPFDSRGGSHG